MAARSEYPAPFMKKDSFRAMRAEKEKLESDTPSRSDHMLKGMRDNSFKLDREGSFKFDHARPELHPIDEDELQRKELERLLGTATDEDRKDKIQKALNALDAAESMSISPSRASSVIQSLHPSAHAHLFSGTKVPVDTAVRGRPVSAQKRRPSVPGLLGSIPENRSIMHEGVGKTTEIELMQDDIADIGSSSFDPKHPPRNLFNPIRRASIAGSSSSSSVTSSPKLLAGKHGRFWVPTGLSPQFLSIQMHMTWKIRKVEVRCNGVDEVTVRIEGGLEQGKRSVVSRHMNRLDDRLFLLNEADLLSASESSEVTGNKIVFLFHGGSSLEFMIVSGLSILVMPTG